jgi:DNA-binding MarR family transcriptional regulator
MMVSSRCIVSDMDGGQLHRLGRRLIELSRAATGQVDDRALTAGQVAVLEDVIKHPDSSVNEIRVRTGFVQSHVSVSVAKLKERGIVETAPDHFDRRRIQVRVVPDAMRTVTQRTNRDIDGAVAEAVTDPERARRVLDLLDELATLLA